jgi:hypothetical protein
MLKKQKFIIIAFILSYLLGAGTVFLLKYNDKGLDQRDKSAVEKKPIKEKVEIKQPYIFSVDELYDNYNIDISIGEIIIITDNLVEYDINYDESILRYTGRVDEGGYQSNNGFEAIKVGKTKLMISNDSKSVVVEVNVLEPKIETPVDNIFEDEIKVSQEIIAKIVGLNIADAERIILEAGINYRIVSEDGLSYPVTMDYSPSRINIELIAKKVHSATLG